MPAHDLDRECHHHPIPHLIDRLKQKMQDTVKPDLPHFDQLCPCQMLAHQHTEHGRGLGIILRPGGEMQPWVGCGRRDQQFMIAALRAHRDHNRLFCRLMDLVHPPANYDRRDLLLELAEKDSV